MVRRPFKTQGNDASWQQRLDEPVDCGTGLTIRGRLAVVEKQPVAVFTFGKPYSRDLGNAMQQLGAKIIGVMPNGVRTNPHNERQIVLMLLPGTKVQMLAAALGFKDKVIDWVMTHPMGSDTGRKLGHTGNRDSHAAARPQVRPAPQVPFRG